MEQKKEYRRLINIKEYDWDETNINCDIRYDIPFEPILIENCKRLRSIEIQEEG